jgi:DNA modification methylase
VTKIENNFNDLGPKEWLPFQKSFTIFHQLDSLVLDNLRFFTKSSDDPAPSIASIGSPDFQISIKENARTLGINHSETRDSFDFLAVDVTGKSIDFDEATKWITELAPKLNHRKFLWVLVPTNQLNENGFPLAWELSNQLSKFLTRKDEKIICLPSGHTWTSLYFRKDEHSQFIPPNHPIAQSSSPDPKFYPTKRSVGRPYPNSLSFKNWFILKPKPRSKDEILHPAKYPEDLVRMYVEEFTKKGDTVFDPMSGTGTTQVESLNLERHAFGIELSELFHGIANKRCDEITTKCNYSVFLGDARDISTFDLLELDYVITSPPYWDMLNMKGAEVQAARKAKGLQTNYSENENDLGNLDDYGKFVEVLMEIYKETTIRLKSGGHLTIIVKNIKKKGNHYPLAFDLTEQLIDFLQLKHVGFWCQDDLQIAPYGYKHTWVSNTFHHYCLTFQKP